MVHQKMFEATYNNQWNLLKSLHDKGENTPFWLFTGDKGSGKSFFAQKWIRYWVRGHDIACDPHVCLIQEEGEITVDSIQKVRSFLSKKHDGQRFVLIDNADRMNRFAQNALLKTFESMYENTMVILIVNHLGGMLPTMISRFHQLNFILDENEIDATLKPLIPYAGTNMHYLKILSQLGGLEWIKNVQDMWTSKQIHEEWVKKHVDHAMDIVYLFGRILYTHCLHAPSDKNLTRFERMNRYLSDLPGTHLRNDDILRTALLLCR
ncbi:MAG: AAA family ATPase [Pseudomonadota bacterium]